MERLLTSINHAQQTEFIQLPGIFLKTLTKVTMQCN